jgi:hypothetical protein
MFTNIIIDGKQNKYLHEFKIIALPLIEHKFIECNNLLIDFLPSFKSLNGYCKSSKSPNIHPYAHQLQR